MKTDYLLRAAVISGLVGFGAVVAGHKLGLEYAGRLLAMTFILVVIGADGRAGKLSPAVSEHAINAAL